MISSILCWFGIHTGKWDAPRNSRTWETTPAGVVSVYYWKIQERHCSECNFYEKKKTADGEERHQPWSADYATKVAELK